MSAHWGPQFTCGHCGEEVRRGKDEPARNHCQACLWSKHTEIGTEFGYPPCGALMNPAPVGNEEVVWRCTGCGFMMRAPTDDYISRTFSAGLGAKAALVLYGREEAGGDRM